MTLDVNSNRADLNEALAPQDEANIIHIPRDFTAKEGTRLTEGLYIGKHISSGLQASTSAHASQPPKSLLL